jgi:hypothetical protein
MKKLFYRFLILILLPISGYSQDKTMEQMTKDYKERVKKSYQDFNDYVTKRDKEFADHLKQYWKEIRLMAPMKPDTTPKPEIVPQYKAPVTKEPASILLPIFPSGIPSMPEELQIQRLPVLEKPEPVEASTENLSFLYYGSTVTLKYDPDIKVNVPAQITGTAIAKYWEVISATHYSSMLSSLETEKNRMQINDWGYLQLVKKAAVKLYPESANAVNLLTWYLLTKAGYKIKVAYYGNEVYLMIPSSNTFYGINFTKFNGINYYLLDKPVPEIFIVGGDFRNRFIK